MKKTVSSRKDFRPHTSDSAPIRGALRNDSSPCEERHRGDESEKTRWKKEERRILGHLRECKEKAYNRTKMIEQSIFYDDLLLSDSSKSRI